MSYGINLYVCSVQRFLILFCIILHDTVVLFTCSCHLWHSFMILQSSLSSPVRFLFSRTFCNKLQYSAANPLFYGLPLHFSSYSTLLQFFLNLARSFIHIQTARLQDLFFILLHLITFGNQLACVAHYCCVVSSLINFGLIFLTICLHMGSCNTALTM